MLLNKVFGGLVVMSSAALAQAATQLFNFTDHYVNIENSIIRPNGQLLLTTFDNGSLYSFDPAAASPQADLVATMPGATGIGGIVAIDSDKYAIIGGIRGTYNYTNETVYTVDYSGQVAIPTIEVVATIPDAIMLNGAAGLPANPHILLLADSRQGAVFRVDTDAGTSEIAFQDELLTPTANATVPIGINGLKIHGGYLYFSNTARYILGRVAIDEDGYKAGDVEVYASVDSNAYAYDWDDFVIDADGNIYTAQTPNAVGLISTDGAQTVVAGGGDDTLMRRPTSVTLAADGKTGYVTTGGTTVDGFQYSGQVIEFQISSAARQ